MSSCTCHILPLIKDLLEQIVLYYYNKQYDCYIWVLTQSVKLYMNESKEDIYHFLIKVFHKFTEIVFNINTNEITDHLQSI